MIARLLSSTFPPIKFLFTNIDLEKIGKTNFDNFLFKIFKNKKILEIGFDSGSRELKSALNISIFANRIIDYLNENRLCYFYQNLSILKFEHFIEEEIKNIDLGMSSDQKIPFEILIEKLKCILCPEDFLENFEKELTFVKENYFLDKKFGTEPQISNSEFLDIHNQEFCASGIKFDSFLFEDENSCKNENNKNETSNNWNCLESLTNIDFNVLEHAPTKFSNKKKKINFLNKSNSKSCIEFSSESKIKKRDKSCRNARKNIVQGLKIKHEKILHKNQNDKNLSSYNKNKKSMVETKNSSGNKNQPENLKNIILTKKNQKRKKWTGFKLKDHEKLEQNIMEKSKKQIMPKQDKILFNFTKYSKNKIALLKKYQNIQKSNKSHSPEKIKLYHSASKTSTRAKTPLRASLVTSEKRQKKIFFSLSNNFKKKKKGNQIRTNILKKLDILQIQNFLLQQKVESLERTVEDFLYGKDLEEKKCLKSKKIKKKSLIQNLISKKI